MTQTTPNEAMMTLSQAALMLPTARLIGRGDVSLARVHTDSRSIKPGDLFVALRGDKFDGNQFLIEARASGAVAAICESNQALAQSGLSGLVVGNARQALASLAGAWRGQFKLPLIAVTGSNGKTTVTQMIASILRAHQPAAMLATEGNFNNDIGVPLTLLRLRPRHRVAVVELGMNHPGEIALLAAIAQPTIALVNNAQREHLEFMASVEAVARENGAVFSAMSNTAIAVFPQDDDFSRLWREMAAPRACLTFSDAPKSAGVDIQCATADWQAGFWHMQVKAPPGVLEFKLHIAGRHNVKNALAAVTCALAAGVPLAAVAAGLENFEPVKGRSRSLEGVVANHHFVLVDDTYNANPDSVKAAIEVLATLAPPRLLVLGDMGEVGESGPQFHAEAGALAKSAGVEGLYTLGELSSRASAEHANGRHFNDVERLNQALLEGVSQFNSVLVKGSRFMRMERVVNALQADAQKKAESTCS
jgi:UDP-N-acetylmuramoyl-tripeptide--D-alanyl-D-alanine ligase